MKENVYKYTQKWVCLKRALRVDENITDTKGNCSQWLWVNTEIQVPPAPAPVADFHPHFSCWPLLQQDSAGSFGNSGKSFLYQTDEALEHLLQSPVLWLLEKLLPVCTRGFWPEPGLTVLVSAPKWSKWDFHLSVPPSYFPVSSSSTDFSLGSRWTFSNRGPSHSKWTVVCCFSIPPIYPFSFPFRLLYLLLSRGVFSHKYSLSALDTSFCYLTHTFCPFSQQSHDLQVIFSTKIGEALSLSSASTQFPALLMLCAWGQVRMSSTEKIFLSLW